MSRHPSLWGWAYPGAQSLAHHELHYCGGVEGELGGFEIQLASGGGCLDLLSDCGCTGSRGVETRVSEHRMCCVHS
jgi:hypothetical protein